MSDLAAVLGLLALLVAFNHLTADTGYSSPPDHATTHVTTTPMGP